MAPATKKPLANGNGAATQSSNYLGFINSGAIALIVAVLAGFWSLADPRSDLKNIRDTYLSLREHNEFTARVLLDVTRIEKVNAEQWNDLLTLREWNVWKGQNDISTGLSQKRLDGLITRDELIAYAARQQMALDSLRREIDQIDKVLNARIVANQLPTK